MDYYQIIPDSDTYDSLRIKAENSLDIYHSLSCQKLIEKWSPVPVGLVKMKLRGDFQSMSGFVTFNEKARVLLKPVLENFVQILPLEYKEGKFYVLNILGKASLDSERAEVERTSSGRIIEIDKYVFKEETVIGKHIFKPEELPYSNPIVSDVFKGFVEKNGLEGLIFKKVCNIGD
jgi:hypothetical protein